MDVRWVKIVSWHAVKFTEPAETDGTEDVHRTHCGLWANGVPVDDLPAEKSCESCLRIIARLNDA